MQITKILNTTRNIYITIFFYTYYLGTNQEEKDFVSWAINNAETQVMHSN